jgi:peroxiredoxin (alkyl hydroperoxide reductase subunit C)
MGEEELDLGCARPTGGPVGVQPDQVPAEREVISIEEVRKSMVSVGKKAPDFEAPAFYEGKFKKIKLSDYLGKWVVLYFYLRDFTFI